MESIVVLVIGRRRKLEVEWVSNLSGEEDGHQYLWGKVVLYT